MRVLTPISSAILFAMICANAQAMSLSQAVQSAVDYHPENKAGINSRLSADEDVKVARGGYFPTVDL
ncbi:MAG: channel protein TolC, partial [Pseudomonas sp.]